jgi:hypothetical protein
MRLLHCAAGGSRRFLTPPARPRKRVPRSFAFFAKGRVPRTPSVAKLRGPILKRNLRPSLVHPHRSSFVEKVETITAHRHCSRALTKPRFTGLRCIYRSFPTRFVHTLKSQERPARSPCASARLPTAWKTRGQTRRTPINSPKTGIPQPSTIKIALLVTDDLY